MAASAAPSACPRGVDWYNSGTGRGGVRRATVKCRPAGRFLLAMDIRREIERRLDCVAPPDGLYFSGE
ncbi:MAG: hypothetical protein IT427_12945 [Pirellulales bacterium]|nr:hypothetical protein [Pirellulales bacterium]